MSVPPTPDFSAMTSREIMDWLKKYSGFFDTASADYLLEYMVTEIEKSEKTKEKTGQALEKDS